MKKLILVTLAMIFFAGWSHAQQDEATFKKKLNSMRVAFITQELDLTADESKAFWPIYSAYTNERRTLRKDNRSTTAKSGMTADEAEELIEGSFANDAKEIELKKKYYGQLKEVIPVEKVAKLSGAEMEFRKKILKAAKERRKNSPRHSPKKK